MTSKVTITNSEALTSRRQLSNNIEAGALVTAGISAAVGIFYKSYMFFIPISLSFFLSFANRRNYDNLTQKVLESALTDTLDSSQEELNQEKFKSLEASVLQNLEREFQKIKKQLIASHHTDNSSILDVIKQGNANQDKVLDFLKIVEERLLSIQTEIEESRFARDNEIQKIQLTENDLDTNESTQLTERYDDIVDELQNSIDSLKDEKIQTASIDYLGFEKLKEKFDITVGYLNKICILFKEVERNLDAIKAASQFSTHHQISLRFFHEIMPILQAWISSSDSDPVLKQVEDPSIRPHEEIEIGEEWDETPRTLGSNLLDR